MSLLLDRNGAPLIDRNGSPIIAVSGAGPEPLPGWPLSVALTFNSSNFDRDYNPFEGGVDPAYQNLHWHPEEGGFVRHSHPQFYGAGAAGNVYLGPHGGVNNPLYSLIFKARFSHEYCTGQQWIANGGGARSPKTSTSFNAFGASCHPDELVIRNQNWKNYVGSYTACGQRGVGIAYPNGSRDLQPGGECDYWSQGPLPPDPKPTFTYQPGPVGGATGGPWITFLMIVTGLNTAWTNYRLYCYTEGGDPIFADRWVLVIDYVWQRDHSSGIAPLYLIRTFLSPYITNKETTIAHDPIFQDYKDGYMCGPYDYSAIMAQPGPWPGPHIADNSYRPG